MSFLFDFLNRAACGSNCNVCNTNGAGNCDAGQCKTGYVYVYATMSCVGSYGFISIQLNITLVLTILFIFVLDAHTNNCVITELST